MYWNPEPFRDLYETLLQCPEQTLSSGALDLLKQLDDDLHDLLATPNKSESARQTLGKGLLKIEGAEIRLSNKFMLTAAQISDELQLDEMVAAQLIFYASSSCKRLGVELAEAAILLFYFRRSHILNIVRFLLESRPSNFAYSKVLGSNPGMLVLKALVGVQKSLEELQERLHRGKFLNLDSNPQFVNTIEAQRKFLIAEHQTLSCILYALVQNDLLSGSVVIDMLQQIREFSSYGSHLFAYLLPLAAWFERLANDKEASKLFDFFNSPSETWRLQWWKGGLSLLFATYYMASSPKHTEQEIFALVRNSVNEGGLEFFAAATHDTSVSGINTTFNDFEPLLRSRVPKVEDIAVSTEILDRLIPTLEVFAETFIGGLASILREMRLSEEDAYLALSSDVSSPRPGVDLERFLLFVAYLYQNRPDAALKFWENQNGPLYGFLKWGASIQVAFISASFNEMLASLSTGELAASAASKFLNEAPTAKSQFSLTWTYVHDVLKYYSLQLEESSDAKLDDDTLIVLFSYLRLTCQIVTDSSDARKQAWDIPSDDKRTTRNLVAMLFNFMRFQTPLYAPIFACLSGVVSEDRADDLWKLCDDWAFTANIVKYQGNGFYYPQSVEPRFDVLLTCVADVLGFVRFISRLSQATSSCKIPASERLKDYCNFVIGEVFVWSNKNDSGLTPQDKALLQSCCMATLSAFLRPLNGKLVQVPASLGQSLNIDNLVEGENTTVAGYLTLFPYEHVLDLCFDRSVYDAIFSIISIGIESLISLPDPESQVQNVIAAIRLVETLLREDKRDTRRFDEPTLYNLRIIPQLAMYWSSQDYDLALASLELVLEISKSDLFTPLPSRRDRILSILETFEGAGNIKLGLIEQMSRDEWAMGELDEGLFNVKVAILELLNSCLRRNDAEPNFAHYLLGFKLPGNGTLLVDDNIVGATGSGISLFDSICLSLRANVSLMNIQAVDLGTAKLTYLLSQVLLHLIRNPLSSSLVLKLFRDKEDYLLELLKQEPVVSTKTLWQGHQLQNGHNSCDGAETFLYYFKRRAALIEMVSLEFHTAAKKQLLSLVSRYVNVLMNLQNQSSTSVLHFLDFMKFRLEKPQQLPANIFDKELSPESSLDVEQLKLVLLVSPTRPQLSEQEVIDLYRENLIYTKLKSAQLACLQPWAQLVPVLVNDTREVADETDTITFVLETIQTLVPKLVESSRIDLTSAKPLASLLVLLLERYQESHKEDDVIALDRLHSLYRAAVMCIQSSTTFASLRSDLYVICYQTLQLTLLSKDNRVFQDKLEAITTFGDRIVQTVVMDSLYAQDDLRLVALIFLQMLATISRALNSTFVENVLVSHNLIQVLVQSLVKVPLNETKVTLCLILELAQSRQCAEQLLQSNIIDACNKMRVFSPEAIREKPQYEVYLIMFQILTAIVLAMGSENSQVTGAVQKFLNRYHHLLVVIIKADSEPHLSTSLLHRCANALTRLVSLVGYTKA